MHLYSQADFARAERDVRRAAGWMAGVLALALAAYVVLVVAGSRSGMLAVLLSAFGFTLFWVDMKLSPLLIWRGFLRDLQNGGRRQISGRIEKLDEAPIRQDGAWVHALQLRLEDGDTRICYLNTLHRNCIPALGSWVQLECCGRHITGIALGEGEKA